MEEEDNHSPQIKGVIIISLPPPDNPSLGKSITAFTFSENPSSEPSLQPNQQQNNPNDQNSDPEFQSYPSNPQLQLSLRSLFSCAPLKIFSFFGVLLFALFLYRSVSPNTSQELLGPSSFLFPLFPNFGVFEQKDVKLKLGKLQNENFVKQRKAHVGAGGGVVDSSSVFPISGDVYPIGSIKDVKGYFKTLNLRFGSKWLILSTLFRIPPEGYLIIKNNGNVCLGILDGSNVNDGSSIILGDISLR